MRLSFPRTVIACFAQASASRRCEREWLRLPSTVPSWACSTTAPCATASNHGFGGRVNAVSESMKAQTGSLVLSS